MGEAQGISLPSTRFRGSKRKNAPWLTNIFSSIGFSSALDAFGGSGTVSFILKLLGKSVTYNDYLKFNYLSGKALIENQRHKLSTEDIIYLTSGVIRENKKYKFIQANFKNIYFLQKENAWLDKAIQKIHYLRANSQQGKKYKEALAYHALFQACLVKRPFNLFHRKNLNIRLNDVPRKFGNKTTWEKPFTDHFLNFINEANSLVFNSHSECRAINSNIMDIDELGFDLVYLDPPYVAQIGSEPPDYLKLYHFLEGIANYVEWENIIDFNTYNLRIYEGYRENYFSPKRINETLSEIIYKFRKSKIVISYKKGGKPSIEFIINLLKKNNKKVFTQSKHYKYALNRQNGNAAKNREFVLVGF